jgi:hypothetical protein
MSRETSVLLRYYRIPEQKKTAEKRPEKKAGRKFKRKGKAAQSKAITSEMKNTHRSLFPAIRV